MIRDEGDETRITKALEAAVQGRTRQAADRVQGAPSLPQSRAKNVENNDGDRERPRDGSFYGTSEAVMGDDDVVRQQELLERSRRPSSASEEEQRSSGGSRWDELRKAQAAPPSRWDTIREENARQSLGSRRTQQGGLDGLSRDSSGGDAGSSDQSYDERRRKFDEMMQREARGEDDEKSWR